MFESAQGSAVLAASDLARARSFYEGVLGLEPVEVSEADGEVRYRLGGVPLMVYRTSYAGTAKNTVFGIETTQLDADMRALRAAGVVFQEYDLPGLVTVDGVATMDDERACWFTDSEGNVLGLFQRV